MHSPSFSVKRPSAVVSLKSDAELLLQMLGGIVAAGQRARQVGAQRELVAARPAARSYML